jgi:hypothetical protein
MGSIQKQYTDYDQALQEHAEATRKSKTWLQPEDICESRHGGNHKSREAFEQIESSRDWQQKQIIGGRNFSDMNDEIRKIRISLETGEPSAV